MEELTKYLGWAVGILGALVLARSQFRGSIFDGNRDFREEAGKLLKIKDQIIAEREAQADSLRLENSLLKDKIADLEKKLEDMDKRIESLESNHGKTLEKLLESASRTTLCVNAQTCLNRVIPTPGN